MEHHMQSNNDNNNNQDPLDNPPNSEEPDPESTLATNDSDILPAMSASEHNAFNQVIGVLFKATHVDFSHYRKTTILRRLSRRMGLCRKSSISEYLDFLKNNSEEIGLLYNDFLLSYTEFFREPFVFDSLKEKVFPRLIQERSPKDTVRVWVPGCSTGEEVYSLAICFYEFLQESKSHANVKAQFFGTDLNPSHIDYARTALYPDKVKKNISLSRVKQFFDQTSLGLKVTKHIREMCVFAVQNVTLDPPFSNIDLVSCRNVLIYFDTAFQEMVIPLFHFSLRNDGFLLLGSSETMGRFPELFNLMDQKINLYTKRYTRSRSIYSFPTDNLFASKSQLNTPDTTEARNGTPDLNQQIDSIILEKFAPPCVVVDSNFMIRQFRGRIFPFLEPVAGDASLKLSKMAGEGLMPELYVAIEEAKKKNGKIRKRDITFKQSDTISTLDISVLPIQDYTRNEQFFLILFEKPPSYINQIDTDPQTDPPQSDLERLRHELQSTKAHLQAIIEEKDEVNQELWASNEEVQSTNEELQSVNEEMEAAKEELESSNEELIALNEEMRAKNIELSIAKEFSENIVETAKTIVVTLDVNGKIITVNRHTEQCTGYKREEIIGKNWFDIFVPVRLHKEIKPLHQKVIDRESSVKLHENPILTRDGSELIINWSNSVLRDSSGQIWATLSIGMDVTEHREAEMALIESEEKYRRLVETSQDCIWQCDSEGRYTYLNPAWETILGYPLEDMYEKKFTEFQSPDAAARDLEEFSRILQGHVSREYETVYLSRSGDEKHLMFNTVAVYDSAGRTTGARGTAHDITEWKTAEQKYRLLFNEMLDGFAHHEIICNEEGKPVNYRFLSINPALEKQTGLKASELIGKTVFDIYPDFDQSWIHIYGKVALTGEPASFEFYFPELSKYFNITAFRPAPKQFACIFNDITEQKKVEHALQESINRFDQLTLQTRTFIWEVNADGLYTFVSPVVKQVLGYSPEEIVNKMHFYDLLPENNREQYKKDIFTIFEAKGQLLDFQNLAVTRDGQQVFLSTYGTPVLQNDGRLIGYRGGNTDITERKNAEAIRQQFEQQQQQTQRLESLGILAGGIAHDFNNLLGGIFGFIDLAIDECRGTRASQYLTTALATIDRARSLTQQLLTFSKGGAPVQSIGPLFPHVKETIQFALSGSNISCLYDIQKELWLCNFDKNQIGQVIDNIVINAQQAMPSGGIIELTARNVRFAESEHPVLAQGEYVKLSIKDYGIGIPKEMLSKIFDPFFTTKAKGHGLGLATCYSIINRHHGSIEVQSQPGKGTTFHIYLPASNDPAIQKQTEIPEKHEGKGIFIVMDDEEVIRLTIEGMLTSFGYTVISFENGKDVIAWYTDALKKQEPVRGMIFDLTIPGGMGGKETINEIRKFDKNIPVFVSSGYADDPVMAHPDEYGFTASICKPFRMSDLMNMLNGHFQN
jgi:two-component system CheB/CheR fusion protein